MPVVIPSLSYSFLVSHVVDIVCICVCDATTDSLKTKGTLYVLYMGVVVCGDADECGEDVGMQWKGERGDVGLVLRPLLNRPSAMPLEHPGSSVKVGDGIE